MRIIDSLHRRIVVAFAMFGVVSLLFFVTTAVVAVEGIEVHLVDQRLAEIATWASPRQAAGLPVEMPAGFSFHRGNAIPHSLSGLPPGVHEIDVDNVSLQVLAGSDAGGPFVVVDHESDYEKVELVVYSLFAAAFLGFLLFGLTLGGFVARRVVNPMTELADAVNARAASLPLLDRPDEIGVLARAFAERTDELRDVLERERFFTGDVSHELRSPLTVIMGAAEILMTQGGDDGVRLPAERIYRAAKEAAECVTVLLLLARAPDLGKADPVSIRDIAMEEVSRHSALVAGKPVELVFRHDGDFFVRAPRELCAAAIGNLVRNAAQYTAHGTVTVSLSGREVIVEDTGPGLPDAVRRTLGTLVREIPSQGSAGTGLGLSLVQRICQYLGASLGYRDRPGGGSIFSIRFPDHFTKS